MAKKSAVGKSNKVDSPKQRRAQKQDREEQPEQVSNFRQKIRDRKKAEPRSKNMAGGNKSKSGCAPKLFMLFLPFTAVGAYFFLMS